MWQLLIMYTFIDGTERIVMLHVVNFVFKPTQYIQNFQYDSVSRQNEIVCAICLSWTDVKDNSENKYTTTNAQPEHFSG